MERNRRGRFLLVAALIVGISVGFISLMGTWWFPGKGSGLEWGAIAGTAAFLISYGVFYFLVKRVFFQKEDGPRGTFHQWKPRKGGGRQREKGSGELKEAREEKVSPSPDPSEEIERLREQEGFRRQFIGNLAHELKTPIFSIQGYIHTLLEGALEDEENNRRFLKKAAKGVDRMIRIVEDLDTITRFEAGGMELTFESVDIVSTTREVMESLEIKASERNIRLKFKEHYGKSLWVRCDKDRIEQVLTNLITNSISYGREGGETQVGFHDRKGHILVEVTDNGLGVAEKDIPRLFERFYRVDKSRSREEGGTGLGLAIVKHLLDAHGQAINVQSTEGVGSTFSFTLEKAG